MKQATNTLIYINMGSEMIFILNNRIKALDIDEGKRLSILAQIAQKLYNSEETDKLIRDCTSTLTLDGLYNLLHKVCHKSVITLDSASFTKMNEMVVMALKKDTLLMKNDFGLYHVTMNHLAGVDSLLKRKDITQAARRQVVRLTSGMRPYDYHLAKKDIVNLLVFKHSKISVYLKDCVQGDDGHFVVRPPRVCGFNCVETGTVGKEGLGDSLTGLSQYLASSKFKALDHFADEQNDKLGCDLFDNLKSSELVVVDKEYLARINTDLSHKILGSRDEYSNEAFQIELDFNLEDTMIQESSHHKSGIEMSIFDKPNQGKKSTGKVMGILDDGDDDTHDNNKLTSQKSNKEVISGNDLLDMMDDL